MENGERLCPFCKAEIKGGDEVKFCTTCGRDISSADDVGAGFESVAEPTPKKSRKKPIIIGIAAAVIIGVIILIVSGRSSNKGELTIDEYLLYAEEFLEYSYNAGANLEEISDTVQRYWYENIYDDKHGADINDAILYAMSDKSSEIELVKTYDDKLKDMYKKVKNIPEGLSEDERDEAKEVRDAVKELYNVYSDFYTFATEPSGSFNTYSERNDSLTDQFTSKYNALKNLLE